MKQYKKRVADAMLSDKLEGVGAVLIEGAKWCGKTTTAEQAASSALYMDDPDRIEQNLMLADTNVKTLLHGQYPRLIDEWQLAPKLWDAIRFCVDHGDQSTKFILTGSSVPADTSLIHHSGTGRFSWLKMRPMSLYESEDSSGDVSLARLFECDSSVEGTSTVSELERLAYLTCRGGWPQTLGMSERAALNVSYDYLDATIYSDINRADGVGKDPDRVRSLMRSLARCQGTQIANTVIADDIKAGGSVTVDNATVARYISALSGIFVEEDMPAWNPNLRSKTAIRATHTRYYVDPSIATAALGVGPNDLINDLKTFGFIFETLCARDLRVYTEPLRGTVYHYRDKNGLECDAVIHLHNGRYGLVEIKLGGDKSIADGCRTLKALESKIDTDRMSVPSFLMVLTGIGQYAYKRPDGICIVPIGCLGP